MLNPRLDDLIPYPFERLASVLDGIAPPADNAPISRPGPRPARRVWREAGVRVLN